MPEYKVLVQGVEVSGRAVMTMLAAMSKKELILKILAVNGIIDPKPDQWYPQQLWLDAIKAISDSIGPIALDSIGKKIPDTVVWPNNVDSIESALQSIDIAYHLNHRLNGKIMYDTETRAMKEGIGHYICDKTSDREIKVLSTTPYPCAFDGGLITGVVNKFKSPGAGMVSVTEDEYGECRSQKGNCCTYVIMW